MAFKQKHILFTFNGGGIMGLSSALIYENLEERVREKLIKNLDDWFTSKNFKLADAITMVAGTSIGALNAAQVVSNVSGSDLLNLYKINTGKIFSGYCKTIGGIWNTKYERHGLDQAIQKYIEQINICDLNKLILIPSFSLDRGSITIWSNCCNKDEGQVAHGTLSDAVKASTAVPVYLSAAKVQYSINDSEDNLNHYEIDGGLFANNPTVLALTMLEKYQKKNKTNDFQDDLEDLVVINIGACQTDNSLKSAKLLSRVSGGAKQYMDDKYIFRCLSAAHNEYTNVIARHQIDNHNGQFFTFNPQLPLYLFNLDNDSIKQMEQMEQYITEVYLHDSNVIDSLDMAANAIANTYIENYFHSNNSTFAA